MTHSRTVGVVLLLGVIALLPWPLWGQASEDPSVHRPVSAEEIEKLRRQIAEQTRSSVELIGEYHNESGDLNNRLDFWRAGAQLNVKWKSNRLLYLRGTRTRYLTRSSFFDGFGANFTAGIKTSLSEGVQLQFEAGATWFNTDTTTVNVLGTLRFEPSDRWSLYATGSRSNVEESLLSATGLRPPTGPFAGKLVGRVMDNRFAVGVVRKLPYRLDIFGEAGLGTRDGKNTGSNFFRAARTGLGLNAVSGSSDADVSLLRVSYLLNYFGFSENRLGFGGASFLDIAGQPVPPALLGSDGISPTPTAGQSGLGGYFSPHYYLAHLGRLELAGTLSPGMIYRISTFGGSQAFTGTSARPIYGASVAVEFVLNDHLSIPVNYFRDNYGPFTQQTVSARLVIGLSRRIPSP